MKRNSYFGHAAGVMAMVFALSRVFFMTYNAKLGPHSFGEWFVAWVSGLPQDVATIAYALVIPAIVTLLACCWRRLPLRCLLAPYHVFLGLAVGCIAVYDAIMYSFWQFKLGAVIISYAMSPEGAANSASLWFIAASIGSGFIAAILLMVAFILLTPRRVQHVKRAATSSALVLVLAVVSALCIDGGTSFRSNRHIFLNNTATNPVYNFFSTVHLRADYAQRFHFMDEAECDATVATLYPQDTGELTDTLLRTQRPDILVVLMESFGGKFVQELGGLPCVAPNLSRLIPEGIFWDNYYSCSFRTDRGTVSLYSGMPAHPDVCLMKQTEFHATLPSLPRSLQRVGYATPYLVGEATTNMGKGTYLANMGFSPILDHTAFRPEELESSWGAYDAVSMQRAVRMVAEKDSVQPLFLAYQTISSHEPWVVPYHRLDDEVLNAFAYTDQCLGDMVDSLRLLPQWDNLLVIVLPDHGFLYEQNFQTPEFFHSPMLWLGGAVREPRRMSAWMNQSDVAATLLAQLGLPHDEYRWSRNVLSTSYTHPFVYCNYPAGIMLRDDTGATIFDLLARKDNYNAPADDGQRLRQAQAILQATYQQLASQQP